MLSRFNHVNRLLGTALSHFYEDRKMQKKNIDSIELFFSISNYECVFWLEILTNIRTIFALAKKLNFNINETYTSIWKCLFHRFIFHESELCCSTECNLQAVSHILNIAAFILFHTIFLWLFTHVSKFK